MQAKKFQLPHIYVLLLSVMLLALLLTYLVPSGEFSRAVDPETGRMLIDPTSYTPISKPLVGLMDYFTAIHTGVMASGDIIVMLLFTAAAIALVDSTGAITAGVQFMLSRMKGMDAYILALVIIIFVCLGLIGNAEGSIPFIPLAISLSFAMGYDRIVGAACCMLGICAGFTAGAFNLYTVGVGHSILRLPLFSGVEFRLVCAVVFSILVIFYILSYARKIKKDPTKSIVAEEYTKQTMTAGEKAETVPLTKARILILLALVTTIGMQVYGTLQLKWYLPQLSAIYIMLAIVAGALHKMSPSEIAIKIAKGASAILPAGLAIGIARAVLVVMEQGKILDTVIHNIAGMLEGQNSLIIVLLVYMIVLFFNFFVTSGSGKAVILIPILGPLAQLIGINQQVMIVAFQFGDGFTNHLWPTSGVLMASLAMAAISWETWVKFSYKLFIMLALAGALMTVVAQLINLGPF